MTRPPTGNVAFVTAAARGQGRAHAVRPPAGVTLPVDAGCVNKR